MKIFYHKNSIYKSFRLENIDELDDNIRYVIVDEMSSDIYDSLIKMSYSSEGVVYSAEVKSFAQRGISIIGTYTLIDIQELKIIQGLSIPYIFRFHNKKHDTCFYSIDNNLLREYFLDCEISDNNNVCVEDTQSIIVNGNNYDLKTYMKTIKKIHTHSTYGAHIKPLILDHFSKI